MLGVNKMYTDKNYRKKVVEHIKDPLVKSFWVDEFATYTDRYTQEATPAIQNKIGQFTGNPLIRNIVGQPKSTFDLREMVDNRKILIVNLSKGKVGEVNANLLGSMLITKLYLAAMSRADVSPRALELLPNFYFYVDEFQSFANESFADILSEARKYKLNLTMAHQYIEQMSEEVRDAVFGNVGTMITFSVGAYDAEVLEKEYMPQFTAQDLVNLGFAQIYLKLMIDGVGSQPFSAETLPPIAQPEVSSRDAVIEYSRKMYANSRAGIEASVKEEYTSQRQVEMGEKTEKRQQEWQERQDRRARGEEPPRPAREESRFRDDRPPMRPREEYQRAPMREGPPRGPRTEYARPSQNAAPRREEEKKPMVESAPRLKEKPRMEPVAPVPEKVHRPFAEALTSIPKAIPETPQVSAPAREAVPFVERKAPIPTALQKEMPRDKGPSQKNMMGLKAALSAVLKDAPKEHSLSRETQEKKITPPTASGSQMKEERKSSDLQESAVLSGKAVHEEVKKEPVVQAPKEEQPRTPPDSVQKETPPRGPNEISKDVLDSVLRGEKPKS
jgi:hypothetical protein